MLFISVLPSSVQCCVQSQRIKFYSQDPKISPKTYQTLIYASAVQRGLTSCRYVHMYVAFLNRNIYVCFMCIYSAPGIVVIACSALIYQLIALSIGKSTCPGTSHQKHHVFSLCHVSLNATCNLFSVCTSSPPNKVRDILFRVWSVF